MALHIENLEVEQLALQLSEQRGVSVEEAVRKALQEAAESSPAIIDRWFETRMKPIIPPGQLGRTLTKKDTEGILGMDK